MLPSIAADDDFEIFLEQGLEPEHDTSPLSGRRFPPGRKGRGCRLNRGIDLLRGAQRRLGNQFAGGRIMHGRRCDAVGLLPLATDEKWNRSELGRFRSFDGYGHKLMTNVE